MRLLLSLLCLLAASCLPLAAQDNTAKPEAKPAAEPPAHRKPAQDGTWTDPSTGLRWAKQDNGSDVNWIEAMSYCRNLNLGGHSGWRLPSIDELQATYDERAAATMVLDGNSHQYHIKGRIILTGWHWSATQYGGGLTGFFNFTTDESLSTFSDSRLHGRALCVRDSGNNTAPVGLSPQPRTPMKPDTKPATGLRGAAPPQAGTWTDRATELMWAGHDNGKDLNWNEATSYCANLKLGGYSGWRLPSIDELRGIYDPGSTATMTLINGHRYDYHTKGGIALTGGHWSATQAGSGFVWYFSFNVGESYEIQPDLRNNARALCVRGSGK